MAYNNIYPMPYPQYQPYPIQQQATSQGINWVLGMAGAQSFPVGAGQSAILMDSEAPYVYKKETAMDGRPLPIEKYRLVKEDDSPKEEKQKNYVTTDQIEEIISDKLEDIVKEEVDRRLSEFSFKPTTRKSKSSED